MHIFLVKGLIQVIITFLITKNTLQSWVQEEFFYNCSTIDIIVCLNFSCMTILKSEKLHVLNDYLNLKIFFKNTASRS